MFLGYACVSSLEGRDLCTCLHTSAHKHTHFPDKTAGSVYRKKLYLKISLSLQNICTYILIILLHFHLAGALVLINCQNVINYVKIVMYIQFGILTWYTYTGTCMRIHGTSTD